MSAFLTWNIQRDDGRGGWPHRCALILRAIREERPAVVGLQEALPAQVEDLASALPEYRVVLGQITPRQEYNPLLVRRDAYDVLDDGTVWLSRRERPEADWGATQVRMATWARLRSRATGDELTVVNTHLDNKSERARLQGARLLAERFPGAVLMGDFNALPESEPHDILTEGRVDTAPAVGAETMHGDSRVADARYDWILVPEPLQDAEARRVGDADASDHYGIVAEVEPRRVAEDV